MRNMKWPHSNKATNQMTTVDTHVISLKWSLFSLGTYKSIIKTTQNKSITHALFGWNSEITLKQRYLFLPSSSIYIINGVFLFF